MDYLSRWYTTGMNLSPGQFEPKHLGGSPNLDKRLDSAQEKQNHRKQLGQDSEAIIDWKAIGILGLLLGFALVMFLLIIRIV